MPRGLLGKAGWDLDADEIYLIAVIGFEYVEGTKGLVKWPALEKDQLLAAEKNPAGGPFVRKFIATYNDSKESVLYPPPNGENSIQIRFTSCARVCETLYSCLWADMSL